MFLVSDARRAGAPDLERYFTIARAGRRPRAGALAIAGHHRLHADAHYVYDRLTDEGLPLVILSALCGLAVLVLLRRGARRGARALAVAAVVAVVWGWGVAQYPYLLPTKLTIAEAAAPSETLTILLDRLRHRGRARPPGDRAAVHARSAQPRLRRRGSAGRGSAWRVSPV